MTLDIIVLNNIFPLHTKTQNYHTNVSQYATLNSVNKFSLEEVLMLTNNIILASSRHDTFQLHASSLGPLQIVYVTRNTMNDATRL